MADKNTLRDLLEMTYSDDLAYLLNDVGLPEGTNKKERIELIIKALLNDELSFADDVGGNARVDQVKNMCMYLSLNHRQNKDDLLDDLDDWFEEHFGDQVDALECEDDEGDTDFELDLRSQEYDELLFSEFDYSSQHSGESRRYQRAAVDTLMNTVGVEKPSLLHIATGGGKTWIANDFLVEWQKVHGGNVLWVTKDWRLLWQAACDLSKRHEGFSEHIARLGGDGRELHPLPESSDARVVYTTLQTFGRREKRPSPKPSLVIWDESHWGENAKLGRKILTWCKRAKIALLGLTATPRSPEHSKFKVVFSKDFSSLISEGHLAKPLTKEPIPTGIAWNAQRTGKYADFKQDSLDKLGRKTKRNDFIVEHYVKNAREYGKTLVFACNIAHADCLVKMFQKRGVPVCPIHSHRLPEENMADLKLFEDDKIQIVINVLQLTHGVDIPSIKTVFMCRPTLSDILFSQMVGRASRIDKASGKTTFNIVEFTDNLSNFGDQLVTATKYFQGTAFGGEGSTKGSRSQKPNPKEHHFDPTGRTVWLPDNPETPEALRGLVYRQDQTFGVELELTTSNFSSDISGAEWRLKAEPLLRALNEALPGRVAERPLFKDDESPVDDEVWNVKWDSSCGWEVTSRILENHEGYDEIRVAFDVLDVLVDELGLKVNYRTGLHLHLGWLGRTVEEVKRAIRLAHVFEPALGTLVAPSRIVHFDGAYKVAEPNEYCRPVSTVFDQKCLDRIECFEDIWQLMGVENNRYLSFNVQPLNEIQTVETRLHNGTTEASKVLLWLSLWQQILWAAAQDKPIELQLDRNVIQPEGDILELVVKYLPEVQQPLFLERLQCRREQIVTLWQNKDELGCWLKYVRGS